MIYRHRIFDLEVASDIPLPMAPAGDVSRPAQIEISTLAELDRAACQANIIQHDGDTVTMTIGGVARYHITGGSKVKVEPVPDADPRALELFLTGSAFGLLLQQRRLTVLHANSLCDGDRAFAVMGPSGAGKSTLAARLCARGLGLLSDDVTAVDVPVDGPAHILPGLARFRLWNDAATALGHDPGSLDRVRLSQNKYVLPADEAANEPKRLAALYVLAKATADKPSNFERLRGRAAIAALMENSYRGHYLRETGASEAHFTQCITLARTIPVIRWHRNWGRDREEQGVTSLIEHFRSQPEAAA